MATVQTGRLAGSPCVSFKSCTPSCLVLKPTFSTKWKLKPPPKHWTVGAVLTTCILLPSTRRCLRVKDLNASLTESQHLLQSTYLNNGCAQTPQTKQTQVSPRSRVREQRQGLSSIRASTACAAKLSNPAATVGSTTTANLSNHNPGDTTGALVLHTVVTDIGKDTGDTTRSTPSTRQTSKTW